MTREDYQKKTTKVMQKLMKLSDKYAEAKEKKKVEAVRECISIIQKEYWDDIDEHTPPKNPSAWLNDAYTKEWELTHSANRWEDDLK